LLSANCTKPINASTKIHDLTTHIDLELRDDLEHNGSPEKEFDEPLTVGPVEMRALEPKMKSVGMFQRECPLVRLAGLGL